MICFLYIHLLALEALKTAHSHTLVVLLLCKRVEVRVVVGCAAIQLMSQIGDLLQLLDGMLVPLQGGLNRLGCLLFALGHLLELSRIALLLSEQLLVFLRGLLRLLNQLLHELRNLLLVISVQSCSSLEGVIAAFDIVPFEAPNYFLFMIKTMCPMGESTI